MSNSKTLRAGQRIADSKGVDKYEIVKKIGQGQFAEVYQVIDISSGSSKSSRSRSQSSGDSAKNSNELRSYALKMETKQNSPLGKEIKTLRKLGDLYQWVCRLMDDGMFEDRVFAVFELGGQNLAEFLDQKDVSVDTIIDIAGRTLKAIQYLHKAGYVHRDIKPANFVQVSTQDGRENTWKLIDFGLARKYNDEKNNHHQERKGSCGFRGSTTYASVAAHKEKDLSRRDDIWSWWYILVEMIEGELPWRKNKPKSEAEAMEYCLQQKNRCLKHPNLLFKSGKIPKVVMEMMTHVSRLEFEDGPDYNLLTELLEKLREIEINRVLPKKDLKHQVQNDGIVLENQNQSPGNTQVTKGSQNEKIQPGGRINPQQQNQTVVDGAVQGKIQNYENIIQQQQQQSQQQQQQLNKNIEINGTIPQQGIQGSPYVPNVQQQQLQQNWHQNKQNALDQQLSNYMQQGNQQHVQYQQNQDQNNANSLKRHRSQEFEQQQQQQQAHKYQKMQYKPLNEDVQKNQPGNSNKRHHERIEFHPTQKSRWDQKDNQNQNIHSGGERGLDYRSKQSTRINAGNIPNVFDTKNQHVNVDSMKMRSRGDNDYQHQQQHYQHHHHQPHHRSKQMSPKAPYHPPQKSVMPSHASNVQIQDFVDAYKHGQFSKGVTYSVENLSKLKPIEAVTAIGTVIEGLTQLQPKKLHRVSKVLEAISQYAKEASEKARQKFQQSSAQNEWP